MKQDGFFDEQIIDMINRAEQKTTGSLSDKPQDLENADGNVEAEKRTIETGIKIAGKWVYFERRLLAGNAVSMMVPEDFEQMAQDMARVKYPSEQRPETILTDGTGTVNLMFQYMDGETDNESIESFRNQIFGMMKRVNPGIKERETGSIDVKGKNIAYVEFSNTAMDGKLYNLMFYMEVKGQPLMGNFNCRTKEMKYWRASAFEMINSIEMAE